jgi:hypothetical protein
MLALALTEITLSHPMGVVDLGGLCTEDGCTDRASQVSKICRNVTDVSATPIKITIAETVITARHQNGIVRIGRFDSGRPTTSTVTIERS